MNHEVNKSLRKKYLNAANIITFMRIVGTAVLLFQKPMSSLFLAVYTFTGLTDAFDGIVARKTGTASEFGSRLDSVADLLFYGVMLIKLLPVLWAALPREIWCAVAVILLVRLCAKEAAQLLLALLLALGHAALLLLAAYVAEGTVLIGHRIVLTTVGALHRLTSQGDLFGFHLVSSFRAGFSPQKTGLSLQFGHDTP